MYRIKVIDKNTQKPLCYVSENISPLKIRYYKTKKETQGAITEIKKWKQLNYKVEEVK